MYTDEIYAAATAISGEESEMLGLLCSAAAEELTGRMRSDISPDRCSEMFIASAALLALSMYRQVAAGSENIASYKAGDVTVTNRGAESTALSSDCLRRQAETMMAPYIEDSGFYFSGVEG